MLLSEAASERLRRRRAHDLSFSRSLPLRRKVTHQTKLAIVPHDKAVLAPVVATFMPPVDTRRLPALLLER
jgi:hypothetical protein